MGKDSLSHSVQHVTSVSEPALKNGVFLLQSQGRHSSIEEEAEWKQKLQRGHAGADGEWGRLECLKRAEPFSVAIFLFLALS